MSTATYAAVPRELPRSIVSLCVALIAVAIIAGCRSKERPRADERAAARVVEPGPVDATSGRWPPNGTVASPPRSGPCLLRRAQIDEPRLGGY